MNVYRKLGVKKRSAKPGDLIAKMNQMQMSPRKMMAAGKMSPSMKIKPRKAKRGDKHEAEEMKLIGKLEAMHEGKKERKPKLGSGKRFQQLKGKLAAKGAENPAGLAAYIGRKKYGKAKFQKLSAQGKKSRGAKKVSGGIALG